MRVAAVALGALAFLTAPGFLRGGILLIWILAAILVAVFALVRGLRGRRDRAPRQPGARVPWLVALAVSAVTIVPQAATWSYTHISSGVIAGLLWWLVLASFLRLVIFLADYYRGRSRGLAKGS